MNKNGPEGPDGLKSKTVPESVLNSIPRVKGMKKEDYGIASFIIFFEDGTEYVVNDGACHFRLNTNRKDKKSSFILSKKMKHKLMNDEVDKIYYSWLMSDSPWSSVFVEKDFTNLTKEQVFIIDAEHPNNLVAGACIATRSPWEHPSRIDNWWKLVEAGIEPNRAYTVASAMTNDNNYFKFNPSKSTDWHYPYTLCSMFGSANQAMENFINNKPQVLNENYSQTNSYNSVAKTWFGGKVVLNLCDKIIDGLDDASIIKRKSNNPFLKEEKRALPFNVGVEIIADVFNSVKEKAG